MRMGGSHFGQAPTALDLPPRGWGGGGGAQLKGHPPTYQLTNTREMYGEFFFSAGNTSPQNHQPTLGPGWDGVAANTFNNIERVYGRAIAFSNRRCSFPLESSRPMTLLCTPSWSIRTAYAYSYTYRSALIGMGWGGVLSEGGTHHFEKGRHAPPYGVV